MPSPELIVVVDTEEAFDWRAPFRRDARDVSHLRGIARLQRLAESYGVRPTYVCDLPVLETPWAVERLEDLWRSGLALMGAHLHPWVTPPYDEPLGAPGSFPGNLPRALEGAKLARLFDAFEAACGRAPEIYMAGRYGIGPNSFDLLAERGVAVDLSPSPLRSYRAEGGPDFSRLAPTPFWPFEVGGLFCLPTTGGMVGALAGRETGRRLNAWARSAVGLRWRAPAALARLRLIELIRLSPEGHAPSDLIRLTRALAAGGVDTFVLNLHSPSIAPGNTPYAPDARSCDRLFETLEAYLAWFVDDFGGRSSDPLARRTRAMAAPETAPALSGRPPAIEWGEPVCA